MTHRKLRSKIEMRFLDSCPLNQRGVQVCCFQDSFDIIRLPLRSVNKLL